MGDREDRERYSTYLRNMRIREDKPFDRITLKGVREIGFKHLGTTTPGEHVIWEIYPDGSAKYVSKYSPNWAIDYRDFIDTIPDDPRVRTEQAMEENRNRNYPKTNDPYYKGITSVPLGKGSPIWEYDFTPDNFKIFKMAASIPISRIAGTPNSEKEVYLINEKGYYRQTWGNWWLPDQAEDAAKMKKWILSLSPTEVFGLYYSLVMFTGPKVNNTGRSCNTREYSPLVTPIQFKENGLWSIFQEMLFRALYDIRTDLHQVKDPVTGKTITGLIYYENFRMACDAPKWMSVVKWVGIAGDVAMAFATLGASTAFQAVSSIVNTAIQIVNIKDENNKAVAVYKFNKTLLDGYNASQDVSNIIKPPPKLTPVEQKLVDKASGETKSPTEVIDGAPTATAAAGGVPWLLIAAAAAAALLS